MPRAILMYIPAVVLAGGWIAIGAVQGESHELPLQSIVNGHRLQPNEKELNAIGRPDLSAPEADEIDSLYGILLHCAASACAAKDHAPLSRPDCGSAASAASTPC